MSLSEILKEGTLMRVFQAVRSFHTAFNHPAPDRPTMIPHKRVLQRVGFMDEENSEFEDAETLVDQVDAALDKLYFALGDLVELGVDPSPLFDIVQAANMAKLGPDGKPIPHATIPGKVAKPPGWQSPEPWIEAEVERQARIAHYGTGRTDPIIYGEAL